MATFDYEGLKVDVDAILAEFGADCSLVRAGDVLSTDLAAGTVTPTDPTVVPVLGVVTEYSEKMVDGETILRGDRVAYVQAESEPRQGDVFVDPAGKRWSVVDYDAVNPAGFTLVYSLQLRK